MSGPIDESAKSDVLSLGQLVRKSITAWSDDYASSMGAALAYYTLFSLAPLLLLVIAVAGMVFGADAARGQIVAQLAGLIGKEGATAVEGLLKSANEPAKSTIASIVGGVTLLIGATSIFAELQSDLDRIWRAPEVVKGNHGSRVNQPIPAGAAPAAKADTLALPPARPAIALLPPHRSPARDFATAGLVWIGFGVVRSVVRRRSVEK